MSWPLPTLPNPFRDQRGGMGTPSGAPNARDPMTALWMLASQPRGQAHSAPAQGLGAAYRLAGNNTTSQQQGADYDKPAASPVSDDASPFNALADTFRNEALNARFPWMGG